MLKLSSFQASFLKKVWIEKYYKEIASLSSCFSNGFKWLYLSLDASTEEEN